jgi:transcriptional regulator with PAS, ATPase and Fis domain
LSGACSRASEQSWLFEVAKGGTLLLDEFENLDYRLQTEVLQVIQEQEFQRLRG